MNVNHEQNVKKLRDWWYDRPETCLDPGQGLQTLREEIVSRIGYLPAFVGQQQCMSFWPRFDVTENDDSYLVSAELPGMDIEDVSLSVGTNDVTISGTRPAAKAEGRRVFLEQLSGDFSRKLTLDNEVNSEAASATLSRGILCISLPKAEQAASGRSAVKIDVA
jgi:HSP20 family molecular chaperone IbpA